MTQEDKELLLKDLCARLPYGVICKDDYAKIEGKLCQIGINYDMGLLSDDYGKTEWTYIPNCRPYLFPLSSMTEEQQEEFDRTYADDMQVVANNLKNRLDRKPCETNLGHYRHIDWLNENHFDYRGLIPKGLAIDATGLIVY